MLKALLALITAALFAGGALYASLVEHPARLRLDDRAALTHWNHMYARAVPLQAGLALVSMLLGLWAWWRMGVDWMLVGGVLVGLAIPFTLIVIHPINRRLKAAMPNGAGEDSRALLVRWGRLHMVRTLLGLAAVAAYFAAFARPELLD